MPNTTTKPTYAEVETVATRLVAQYPELARRYRKGSHKAVGYLMARVLMHYDSPLEATRDLAAEEPLRPDPLHVKTAVETALMSVPV